MKENYWDQFMASGRIDDYMKYKMCETDKDKKEEVRKVYLTDRLQKGCPESVSKRS